MAARPTPSCSRSWRRRRSASGRLCGALDACAAQPSPHRCAARRRARATQPSVGLACPAVGSTALPGDVETGDAMHPTVSQPPVPDPPGREGRQAGRSLATLRQWAAMKPRGPAQRGIRVAATSFREIRSGWRSAFFASQGFPARGDRGGPGWTVARSGPAWPSRDRCPGGRAGNRSRPSTWWKFADRLRCLSVRLLWVEVGAARCRASGRGPAAAASAAARR